MRIADANGCRAAALTAAAGSGTLVRVISSLWKGVGRLAVSARRRGTGGVFLSVCLFAVLVLPAGVHGETNAARGAVAATNRTHIIDVRTDAEWKAGHIEGATLIPYDQIAARIAEVTTDKSAPIALYCRSGRRSGIARKSLLELGYTNVENLGGLEDARKTLGVSP